MKILTLGGSRLRDYKDLIERYINLQNDQLRNMWYLKSFANCIKDKDCVEIGTGLGVLSWIAIGFEPKSLIAYEGSKTAYDIAKQCLNKNIDLRNIIVENLKKRMFLIKKTSASNTVSIFFLIPATSAFMAWLFLNESLTKLDLIGFLK